MSNRNVARTEYLADQKQALWNYLDALLQEVPEHTDAGEPPVETLTVAEGPDVVADPDVLEAPTYQEEACEPLAPEFEEAQPESPPAVEMTPAPVEEPEPEAGSPVPEWAEPDFQALIFHVGSLKLAVPLVKLHSVVPWEDQITPTPNKPDWCHGLFHYRGHNVRVVDTARLVLPPEKRALDGAGQPTQILVVGDGRWAMSCTSIGDVVKLTPGEVKWRTAQGRRPWLAGTVRERLCAVMDTEAFAAMLDDA